MKKFVRIFCLALVAVLMVATLASCGAPAKDPADAKAALDEAEYKTIKLDSDLELIGLTALGIDDVDCMVSGTKVVEDKDGEKKTEHVTVIYFESKDAAKAAMEKIDEYADKDENKDESNWVVPTQSGNMIYYGTKQGVKDAK